VARYCVGPTMAVDWGDDGRIIVTRPLLRRVFSYFAPHKRRGLAVVGFLALDAALGLAPALVFKNVIDYLARPGGHFGHLALLVAAGIGAVIAGGLISVAESYVTSLISQDIVYHLRKQLFENLLEQPVSFFTKSRSGDVMSRMSNDIDGVEDVVTDTVFGVVNNLLVGVATLVLMMNFSWQLTIVVLLLIPLIAFPTRRAGERTYRARQKTQRQMGELSAYVQEVLGISGILLLKAFGKAPAERARFGLLNHTLRRLQIRQQMIGNWFGMLMRIVQNTGPALIMLAGGWLVLRGDSTVGTVFVFSTMLAQRLGGSVTSLATMHVNVTGSLALFGRLFEYIDRTPEVGDTPDARVLTDVRGALAFENVNFTYPGQKRPALHAVSVQIEPGQLVALVGPSGAGKTTFTNLVARFYDPDAGAVCVDGHDLRSITLESLTAQLGVVFQDTFLFHTSIADNLRYARPDATDAELVAAAKAAYLHEFITSLPEGYDTVVGERGHRLSGGEKQRVAIARVVLKDPRILILDEATSNLDTVSEQYIQAALRPLFTGRTSLVIAHRLSTVLAADQILVLDDGRIVDHGTHTELLEHGGLYATLYEKQFRAHPAPAEPAWS
jgi:ATP-binding cassette subfamily B protein